MLQRVNKLKQTLKEKNLDGFLVSNFHNIFYLSGFKTLTDDEREEWLLVTTRNAYLFTDSRYLNVKFQMTNFKSISNDKFLILKLITPHKGLISHLKEITKEEKILKLGVEGDDLKISEFNKLKQELVGIEIVPTEKIIINQRAVKDDEEIGKIRKACQIVDQCLSEIIKTIKVGTSEKEIAFKIEFWLKEKNYALAFYPIVAVDENSSIPHYDTRSGNNKRVKNNSIILIDFGTKYEDYLSDISRMIFVGKPTDEQLNVYRKLLSAQEKTIARLLHRVGEIDGGTRLQSIDSFCHQQLTSHYSHSTGHGVGLEVHEYPKISITSTDTLQPNQVFTIEPGVYFEGKWGMRIEDTVVVKKDIVEVLTKFNKQPLIINV